MEGEKMNDMPIAFERELYRAASRFKEANPGVLETRTAERKQKEQASHRRPNGSVIKNGKVVEQ